MRTLLESDTADDSQLVGLCLSGNRDAFAQIVVRYQSLICSIAYSACGDIGRSEDLAQDTFIAAWKTLRELREPDKLKSWLCAIARNLANNSVRRQQRTPGATAGPLPPESCSAGATPHEEAVSREEEALMWRSLEAIPETYRVPMILYYRENQSTRTVADALEISEEAVRQRLARGREMLTERVAKTVESALLKTAPGNAFTVAVLAALPPISMPLKVAGLAGLLKAAFAPFFSLLLPYTMYRAEMEDASSPGRRRFIRKFFGILIGGMALYMAMALTLGKLGGSLAHSHPALHSGLWIGMLLSYLVFVVALVLWPYRRHRTGADTEAAPPEPLFEYRSKSTLLGLPLIHIRIRGGMARGPVKAWFAGGDTARGLIFAYGARAIAPISFGGFSIGILSFGGFAIGLLPFGGFSLGPWSCGAFAAGWQASGAFAAGWLAADGQVALAHGFAQGGTVALAPHANDAAAAVFFNSSPFFQDVQAMLRYSNWLYLLWLYPLVVWWAIIRKKKQAKKIPVRA